MNCSMSHYTNNLILGNLFPASFFALSHHKTLGFVKLKLNVVKISTLKIKVMKENDLTT